MLIHLYYITISAEIISKLIFICFKWSVMLGFLFTTLRRQPQFSILLSCQNT